MECCLNVLWIFEILKNSPSITLWLNGRWFLQIVDRDFNMELNGRCFLQIVNRDSGNLYSISPPFPCFDFWHVGGGGGVFSRTYKTSFHVLFTFHAITNTFLIKQIGGGGVEGGVFVKNKKNLISCFFAFWCYFPAFLELLNLKNIFFCGGGGCFCQKNLISCFMLCPTSLEETKIVKNKKILISCFSSRFCAIFKHF